MTARVLTLFPWPQLSQDNFGAFWQLYPRRVCKLDAQRAWARLTPHERIEALRVIPQHVDQWQAEGRKRWHMPHASTWLNGKRWLDELDSQADLGQCEWNKNGTREPGAPRCEHRARHTSERGNIYCEAHALSLGLVKRRVPA